MKTNERLEAISKHAKSSATILADFIHNSGLDQDGQDWVVNLIDVTGTEFIGQNKKNSRVALAALDMFSAQLKNALDTVITGDETM